jgi:hypothetical protein
MKRLKCALIIICLFSLFNILLNCHSLNLKLNLNFAKTNEYINKANISKCLNTVYKNLKDQRDFFKDQIKTILTYYNNDTMINRKEFSQKIETFTSGFNERSKYV